MFGNVILMILDYQFSAEITLAALALSSNLVRPSTLNYTAFLISSATTPRKPPALFVPRLCPAILPTKGLQPQLASDLAAVYNLRGEPGCRRCDSLNILPISRVKVDRSGRIGPASGLRVPTEKK